MAGAQKLPGCKGPWRRCRLGAMAASFRVQTPLSHVHLGGRGCPRRGPGACARSQPRQGLGPTRRGHSWATSRTQCVQGPLAVALKIAARTRPGTEWRGGPSAELMKAEGGGLAEIIKKSGRQGRRTSDFHMSHRAVQNNEAKLRGCRTAVRLMAGRALGIPAPHAKGSGSWPTCMPKSSQRASPITKQAPTSSPGRVSCAIKNRGHPPIWYKTARFRMLRKVTQQKAAWVWRCMRPQPLGSLQSSWRVNIA